MIKKAPIESCSKCIYHDTINRRGVDLPLALFCVHPKWSSGYAKIETPFVGFPEWCPLEDFEKEKKKYPSCYVVEIAPGVWLQPMYKRQNGKTTIRDNARRYGRWQDAKTALTCAQKKFKKKFECARIEKASRK